MLLFYIADGLLFKQLYVGTTFINLLNHFDGEHSVLSPNSNFGMQNFLSVSMSDYYLDSPGVITMVDMFKYLAQ